MLKFLLIILQKPKNIIFLVFGSFVVFYLIRTVPFYEQMMQLLALPNMTFFLQIQVLNEYVFATFFLTPLSEQILQILLSVFTALNVLLLLIFSKKQQKFFKNKSFWSGISGMVLGLFGIGCVSCGVFVLAPFISFFGLGLYLNFFATHALFISFFGLFLVILSCLFLLKKLTKPIICKL